MVLVTCAILLWVPATGAFDELTPAQTLIYDTPHLRNTAVGDELHYGYRLESDGVTDIEDVATLEITGSGENGRRDVQVDFLSDERHLALPTFEGWRGNPILLAMLERVAQDLSAETGGGAVYFRNRIRDGMAGEAAELGAVKADWQGESVEAMRLHFQPFTNDAYLGKRRGIATSEFSFVISDAVPGGVLSVEVTAREGEKLLRSRELVLDEVSR